MANKRVTLYVDAKIYDEYKKYCEEKGIILSKQFELFMKEKIKKLSNKQQGGLWWQEKIIKKKM